MSWFEARDVSKEFAGLKALSDFSCSVQQGEIVGLIGPNGAGKSTFFNLVCGFWRASRGSASFRGVELLGLAPHEVARAGVARTFQQLRVVLSMSTIDNVLLWFPGQPGESMTNLFVRGRVCAAAEQSNRSAAMALLESVGLSAKLNDPAGAMSYGQQKLLSLMCCMASNADLLLLDEPVAGISPEMTEQILGLIRTLPTKGKSVLLIEHNLDAAMRVCDRLIFLDAGVKVCEGAPTDVRNDPRVIEAYLD